MARNKYRQVTYKGEFSCGHESSIRIGGYSDDYRDSEAKQEFENVCPECRRALKLEEYRKQAEKANEEALKIGLPELEGTEKQVQWATAIRQEWMDEFKENVKYVLQYEIIETYQEQGRFVSFVSKEFDKKLNDLEYKIRASDNEEEKDALYRELFNTVKDNLAEIRIGLLKAFTNLLNTETSARFYIDNRGTFNRIFNGESGFNYILENYIPKDIEEELEEELEKEIELKIEIEQIVYPQNYIDFDVIIETEENKILLYAKKNDEFRKIVKDLGYRWGDKRWYRRIKNYNGSIADRIAEVGNHLLNAGYSVQFKVNDYRNIKQKAISGEYEVEHGRWILLSEDKKKFEVAWLGFDRDLYDKVKALPSSNYNGATTRVDVNINYFKDVVDMASLYGFKFTEEAEEVIEMLKKAEDEKYLIAESKKKEYPDGLNEILQSSTEVLGDLKDE